MMDPADLQPNARARGFFIATLVFIAISPQRGNAIDERIGPAFKAASGVSVQGEVAPIRADDFPFTISVTDIWNNPYSDSHDVIDIDFKAKSTARLARGRYIGVGNAILQHKITKAKVRFPYVVDVEVLRRASRQDVVLTRYSVQFKEPGALAWVKTARPVDIESTFVVTDWKYLPPDNP